MTLLSLTCSKRLLGVDFARHVPRAARLLDSRPGRRWRFAIALGVACLITSGTSTALASPIVWVVNPVSGDIIRMNPRTGAVLGSFAPPPADPLDPFSSQLRPGQGDRNLGLTIADNGKTLLFQLGAPPFDEPGRRTLFGLDPLTGLVKYTVEQVSAFQAGPSGLSSVGDSLFWNHEAFFGDAHLIEAFRGPGKSETVLWVSGSIAGLGGDDTRRQFGVLCEEPTFTTDCDGGPRLIGQFDPLNDHGYFNTFAAPTNDIYGLAFDGHVLYASSAAGMLYSIDPDTGAVLGQPVRLPGPYTFEDGTVALHTFDIAAVPEPTVLMLFGVSAAGLLARRRKSLTYSPPPPQSRLAG